MRAFFLRSFVFACLAVAVPLSSPEHALATLVTELSVEELAAQADVIVHARVARVAARTLPLHGRLVPFRITTLSVIEWVKGQGGDEILVREIGGESRGVRVEREGTPEYRRGEEVLVFLRRDGDAYATLGMSQGCFRILGDHAHGRFVERDLEGLSYVRADGSRVVPPPREPRTPAQDLLTRVRHAAAAHGGTR